MKSACAFLLLAAGAEAVCPNSCSGNGVCGQYDQCTCNANFRASDCSQRVCPYANAWITTAKGDINFDGDVRGYTVYNTDSTFKSGTSVITTQEAPGGEWESMPSYAKAGEAHFYMECANRGLCDRETGLCECFPGYEGYACNRMTCPNDCSGKGVCQSTAYLTANPEQVTNSWYNTVQSSATYGLWDADMAMSCKCDPGYSGPDCSRRMCPVGDDILTQVDQVSETQFIDIKTKCEGTVDCSSMVTPSASTTLAGAIKLTYTDRFGEKYTTEPISGVEPYVATASHTLAVNAQAALRGLPNNVIPPTVEVKATYCDKHEPIRYDIAADGTGGPASTNFRVIGSTHRGGQVIDDTGKLIVLDSSSTDAGATTGTYAKGETLAGVTAETNQKIASLADPLCIRLVVSFAGIAGDINPLEVDVSEVTYNGYSNAQHATANIEATVADSITVAEGGTYTYVAPGSMTVVSTDYGGSVTNEASCTSSTAITEACTVVMFSDASINNDATDTFYPKTKIDITCILASGTSRSLGTHEIAEVDVTNTKFILSGLIPQSTISATGCTSANIQITGRTHFITVGADADATAAGSETGIDFADVMSELIVSQNHGLHVKAKFTVAAGGDLTTEVVELEHASEYASSHQVAKDIGSANAKTSIVIFETSSLSTAGNNAAASSVGTILSSSNAAHAEKITVGASTFAGKTNAETGVEFIVSGKGTTEAVECGARGLCDTEAGECKCFPGYIGLSCSSQYAMAM